MSLKSLDGLGERISNRVHSQIQLQFCEAFDGVAKRACNTGMEHLPPLEMSSNAMSPGRASPSTSPEIPSPSVESPSNPPNPIAKQLVNRDAEADSQGEKNTKSKTDAQAKKKKLGPPSLLLDDPIEPGKELPENRKELPSMGEAVDQWDAQIVEAAERWGVPAAQLKAMVWIETGGAGDPNAVQINPYYGNTYGLTQINPIYWKDTATNLGYDLNTVEGQLGMGAYILREGYNVTGSWDGASSWYFNPAGTGDAVNNTTNAEYIARMHELMGY